MSTREIAVVHPPTTPQSCAHSYLRGARTAPKATTATSVTIESKIFIILKSTNLNTALATLTTWISVSMGSFVPLHMLRVSSRSIFSRRWSVMLTSICFTSRLSGVHSVIRSIKETNVSTLTTGKISDARPTFLIIHITSALNGLQRKTPRLTKMDASLSTAAINVTGGRSSNITHVTIRHVSVEPTSKKGLVVSPTVPTTITSPRRELWTQIPTLRSTQETAGKQFRRPSSTRSISWRPCLPIKKERLKSNTSKTTGRKTLAILTKQFTAVVR